MTKKHGVITARWPYADGELTNGRGFLDTLLVNWRAEVGVVRSNVHLTDEGQRAQLRARREGKLEHIEELKRLAKGIENKRGHMRRALDAAAKATDPEAIYNRREIRDVFKLLDRADQRSALLEALERRDTEMLVALRDAPGIYGEFIPTDLQDYVNQMLMEHANPDLAKEYDDLGQRLTLFSTAVTEAEQYILRSSEADPIEAARIEQEASMGERIIIRGGGQ